MKAVGKRALRWMIGSHDTKLDPIPLPSFKNHGVYLEQGTETLQDIGRVVAGTKK